MLGVGLVGDIVRHAARASRRCRLATGWRLLLAVATMASSTACSSRRGWRWPPCATTRRRRARSASTRARETYVYSRCRLHHRADRRADLCAEGAHLRRTPPSRSIDWTAYVIFIVVIGGIGTIEGPIVGVIVFLLLQNMLADYGSWYLLVLGLIGIAVMLFAPRGLWGLFADRTGNPAFSGPPHAARRAAHQTRRERRMADITTDVLIIGTGPAGSAPQRCSRPTASRT